MIVKSMGISSDVVYISLMLNFNILPYFKLDKLVKSCKGSMLRHI